MDTTLFISAAEWMRLKSHLLQNDQEQVAIAFAQFSEFVNGDIELRVIETYACKPRDYEFQSGWHIELGAEVQGRIIKQAWDLRAAFVEIHSHVGDGACAKFSPSDLRGFREFVPHVRWRLCGAPYVAIVAAGDAIDALVWVGSSSAPGALKHVIATDEYLYPTNATLAAMSTGGVTLERVPEIRRLRHG